MARRRRPAAAPVEMEPPEWLWQFPRRDPQWRREGDGGPDKDWCAAEVAARQRWREACRAWLDERGLVMWSASAVTGPEFKRIQREEPHRILRRPER